MPSGDPREPILPVDVPASTHPGRRRGAFHETTTGHLVATEEASAPRQGLGRLVTQFKHVLVGKPIASMQLAHERIPKYKALAVYASDALSSVAYGTEQILLVLVAAGASAVWLSLPIATAITLLLAIVAFSYSQTIRQYPQGGGTYVVTKDNLGTAPALIAGSALMIDYVLTVAVSISSGVAAVTSAFAWLHPWRLDMALAAVVFIVVANLRGIRESATIFAAPTYMFIASVALVLGAGAWRVLAGLPPLQDVSAVAPPAVEALGVFVVLKAFASGCSAMTGTEAISDGIPAFQAPQARNAVITLVWMAVILGVMFMGITLLAHHYQVLPNPSETVLSQLARATVGKGTAYFFVQASTAMVLVLAANTSFADFPRLAYFLARDSFLPRQFVNRGDRLAFSTGILALGVLAAGLMIAYHADTDELIPLYAIGVFISFTFSQVSMAKRWWTRREPGWRKGLAINGVGTLVTGLVASIILSTKFMSGAWIVILLLGAIFVCMRGIHRHYADVVHQLAFKPRDFSGFPLRPSHVIIPISGINKASVRTLRYALSLSERVTAVHVTDETEAGASLRAEWETYHVDVPLVIIESPYRSLIAPLMAYLDTLDTDNHKDPVTVILSEIVPRRWWEFLLHNQDAWRLKLALFFRPNVAVIDVPYHLQ